MIDLQLVDSIGMKLSHIQGLTDILGSVDTAALRPDTPLQVAELAHDIACEAKAELEEWWDARRLGFTESKTIRWAEKIISEIDRHNQLG